MNSSFNPDRQNEDVDSKIVAALDRIAQAFRVLLWEKTKQHQLRPIQIQILIYLLYHADDEVTVGHLARHFNLTPATVSDAIKTLVRKSYVERRISGRDRRSAHLHLTDAGAALARTVATWADTVRELLARFDFQERTVVMQFLMRLIEMLQQQQLISLTRMCFTCKFLRSQPQPDAQMTFFCDLMHKPLKVHSLRLDCPDHENVSS